MLRNEKGARQALGIVTMETAIAELEAVVLALLHRQLLADFHLDVEGEGRTHFVLTLHPNLSIQLFKDHFRDGETVAHTTSVSLPLLREFAKEDKKPLDILWLNTDAGV